MRRTLVSVRGHHFLADMLGRDSTVLDLGAHLGEFSQALQERYGCRCVAVEANPALFDGIAAGKGVDKIRCAISGTDGVVSFALDSNPESSHLASDGRPGDETIEVESCTLDTVCRRAGIASIDLLKIDVEGAEIAVLASIEDEVLRGIPQITVEFHDFIEALQIGPAVEAAKQRLVSLDFACIVFSRTNHGDVLFLNRRHWRASLLDRLYVEHLARYVRGTVRILQRFLLS